MKPLLGLLVDLIGTRRPRHEATALCSLRTKFLALGNFALNVDGDLDRVSHDRPRGGEKPALTSRPQSHDKRFFSADDNAYLPRARRQVRFP
jgi:hypothetical protein